MYRIGVDVGGTNTDAAVLDIRAFQTKSRGVLASSKTPTTPDVTSGIKTAIENVLQKSSVARQDILSVAVGTTHFVNAVVEADERRLSQVAVVRLCGDYTRSLPPFTDFPPALKKIISGPIFYLDGGLEIDGREITCLDPEQIKATVTSIQKAGITMVAVVGVFSPLDHRGIHEETCKKVMLDLDPSLSIVCSHTIGGVGLLQRENATILNASILKLARRTVRGFCQAISDLQLSCTLYLTQNDGTLTDAVTASELPINAFASGPTNSMTGAAFLAGIDTKSRKHLDRQIMVVDVGGTTTDVCALLPSGFPRQAPNFVEVGGVRTAFSMPEVSSVGLGGGSIVRQDETTGAVTVGPDSVGHYLTSKSLVFGGDVPTATDIVVATGAQSIGDLSKAMEVSQETVREARKCIKKILERAVDAMKISATPVTVLLVGGGSILYMDALDGVEECIIPPHHGSANAVGAAIAKVAGTVDIIEILADRDEAQIVKATKEQAIDVAVARGADRDDVTIAEVEKLPLQYVSNKATRILVKAVGRLRIPDTTPGSDSDMNLISGDSGEAYDEAPKSAAAGDTAMSSVKYSIYLDIPSYRPDVKNGVWSISPVDLEFIASGAGVLGTGGGGPAYLQYLMALNTLTDSAPGKMRVISHQKLADSDVCGFGSWYGAPSVYGERLPAGSELAKTIDTSIKLSQLKQIDAIVTNEIGGGNGIAAFPIGADYDIPVVDADLMGRAFPTMGQQTPYAYGHKMTPAVIADPRGNIAVVWESDSDIKAEKMMRTVCVELGSVTAISTAPMYASVIKQYAIPNTISQAWYLGRAIHMARHTKCDIVKAMFETTPGKLLYTGKIIDVGRNTSGGFTLGFCVLAPLSIDEMDVSVSSDDSNNSTIQETRQLIIPFQNEFLYAAYVNDEEHLEDPDKQEVICTVPDLISILGQDGEAIGSQDLRYGLRVCVVAMPGHPLWTDDERGLAVGGPKSFGLDMKWKSIGKYEKPRSVIDEFNIDQ